MYNITHLCSPVDHFGLESCPQNTVCPSSEGCLVLGKHIHTDKLGNVDFPTSDHGNFTEHHQQVESKHATAEYCRHGAMEHATAVFDRSSWSMLAVAVQIKANTSRIVKWRTVTSHCT